MVYGNHCFRPHYVITLRPRQNGRHFTDDIFNGIFFNENASIPIKISLKFVPKGPINNILSLVQLMTWRRPGDKPLSEPMMFSVPTHICVTRLQRVYTNTFFGMLAFENNVFMMYRKGIQVLKYRRPFVRFEIPFSTEPMLEEGAFHMRHYCNVVVIDVSNLVGSKSVPN